MGGFWYTSVINMKNVFLFFACFLAISLKADIARFSVVVLDYEEGFPISNATVRANFSKDIGLRAWTELSRPDVAIETTDKNGECVLKGKTNCGRVVCWVSKPPKNYYSGNGWGHRYKEKSILGVWQPDNLVVTLRLQRVEHPIPLWVKKADLRNFENGIGGFDGTNSIVRFDFLKGDWLPPYGKGEVADVEFRSTVKFTDKERKFRYATRRVEDVLFYNLGTVISMCSKEDALSTSVIEKNAGIKIRKAKENLVSSEIVNNRGMRKIINPKFKNEWHCEYYSNFKESNCYQFRIRSKYDEKGNLKEAYYGKIYGDFEIEGDEKKGVTRISFLYYLNPVSLDRNLEWDMKNNLCPNPGSLSQPMP